MSTAQDKIVFYNAEVCPYAQRVAIALKEVGAEYETVLIDLSNKPEWYIKDVNPEGKVPALNVEGQNIAESLVLIEYINDRFPEANLMPKEAIKRANIRFVIEHFAKVNASVYKYMFNFKGEGARETFETDVNAALVRLDQLLKQQSATGPYFLGEQFSLADIALAPFVLRTEAFTKLVLDGYKFDAIKNSPRLASFYEGVTSRPSAKETYYGDREYLTLAINKFNLDIKL